MSKKPSNKTEQEQPKTKYDRKMEARRKAAAKDKRDALIFRAVCIVIIAAIIGTAGYFGVKRYLEIKSVTQDAYVSVGDHTLTQLEYDYYFNTAVNNYVNTYSYYLSYIGLDTTLPLDEQAYSEDMTWQEYFEDLTLEQIQQEYALLDDAKANGFEYDTTQDFEEFVATAKTSAETNQISLRNYYKSLFGEYATAKNVKPFMENSYITNAYYEKLVEDNTPSDAEVSAYYEENKTDYDKVSFYSFTFDPANYVADTTDADTADSEEATDETDTTETASEETGSDETTADDTSATDTTEDSTDDSYTNVASLAAEMQTRLEDGEDFETLCMEYATEDQKANYEATDSEYSLTSDTICSYTNSDYSEWLSDESRKEGDITVIEVADSGACYVLKFVSRTYDETCLESISSTLSSEAAYAYLSALLEDSYAITDIKGEISCLQEDDAEESADTTSEESLLDTSIIE